MNHRAAYISEHGPIPDGFHIHHLCGRSDCTNWQHLVALAPHDHLKFHRIVCEIPSTLRSTPIVRSIPVPATDQVVQAS